MAPTKSAAIHEPLLGTPDIEELRARTAGAESNRHAYVALLGLRTYEPLRIVASVRKGLPYSALLRLQRNSGIPIATLAELAQIPARTLARRKQHGKFDPDESDRLVRVARVIGRALELFEGEVRAARDWLVTAQMALGKRTPLDLATTDVGAREVENLVGRLEHGIAT